jgi:hypothetical protein
MSSCLPRAALDRARRYLIEHGRPVDRALQEWTFGAGSKDAVLVALAAYQNADGGFGHALEPDLRTPASTAIATSVALQILRHIGATADYPMVAATIGYLVATLDRDRGVWPIIGPTVDLAPHAPWWRYGPDLAQQWNGFRFNPSAELLGALIDYAPFAHAGLVREVEARTLEAVRTTDRLESPYDLMAAWRLRRTVDLPTELARALDRLLEASIVAAVGDAHFNYLELAPFSAGPLADLLAPRFDKAVEAAIAAQQPDGCWMPFWDWADTSAEGWQAALADWRSALTRRTIEVLTAQDRIEPA